MTVLTLIAAALLLPTAPADHGAIGGIVVNAGTGQPVADAEVVLQVKLDGRFVPMHKASSDAKGKFLFNNLLVGPYYEYLPGAHHDGVHYPGSRLRLTEQKRYVLTKIEVCDAVQEPSPLLIRQYEIFVRPEPGALHITESLLVENPTKTCYVGKAAGEEEPVTLELAIPPDFTQATFFKEFLGRRFNVRNGKVATGIPWTPGQREVTFSYVLPNESQHYVWQRPLDLPCSEIRVVIGTDRADEVSLNLPKGPPGKNGEVVFEARHEQLPAGYVLQLELGQLPVPWMTYGRRAALAVVVLFVLGATAVLLRKRTTKRNAASGGPDTPPRELAAAGSERHSRGKKRGRKAKKSFRRAA